MIMEYRFRGYDVTGQKGWVYGDLTHSKRILQEAPFLADRVMVGGYEVYPESVGLWTTVKDIYEGDVVETVRDDGERMEGVVEWHQPFGGFLVRCERGSGFVGHYFFSGDWNVIGNVFENSLKSRLYGNNRKSNQGSRRAGVNVEEA